jgi:hypothetical protein
MHRNVKKKPVATALDAKHVKALSATAPAITTRKDSMMQDNPQRPYSGKSEGSNWSPIRTNPGPVKKAIQVIKEKMKPHRLTNE